MRRIQRCAKCKGFYRPVTKNLCPWCLENKPVDTRKTPQAILTRLTKKMKEDEK